MESTEPQQPTQVNYDKIGEYNLLHNLGSGAYSKVKLGEHEQTKQRVAIKIHKEANFDESIRDLLDTELSAMYRLNGTRNYIVNLISFRAS